MFETLKRVPLFADLPDDDLLRLSEGVEQIEMTAGQELFAEGMRAIELT